MRRILTFTVLLFAICGCACTQNQMARNWGGTQTIALPKDRKLVNATWKESNLWILTRQSRPGESPETYEFKEKSSFGQLEGTIILKEQ